MTQKSTLVSMTVGGIIVARTLSFGPLEFKDVSNSQITLNVFQVLVAS